MKVCELVNKIVDHYIDIRINEYNGTEKREYVFKPHSIDLTKVPEDIWNAEVNMIVLHHDCISIDVEAETEKHKKWKQWTPNAKERILIEKIEVAKRYCKGELELDLFENDEFGDGWYAMDYREDLECAFPIDQYEKPLIKIQTTHKYNIDVRKCCDYCDVAYVG